MRRLLALLAVSTLLAAPAAAEDISAETDHVLWCASAYALLANDASEQADVIETELYDQMAATLTQKGIELLRARKVADEKIGAIIQAYDDAVYIQLDTPQAKYPVETCEPLANG
ncbi:MAG TPA: hypothetical protein VIN06_09150 [Devosia sp.]